MSQHGDESGCCHLPGEVKKLQARVSRLREALRPYTNPVNWERLESGQYAWNLYTVPWSIAQDALNEREE